MKRGSVWIVAALCLFGSASNAQQPAWQKAMEQDRRSAVAGNATVLVLNPSSPDASPAAGVYAFYNSPRPFCYTYVIPGQWYGGPDLFHSKDRRTAVSVNVRLPQTLGGIEGAPLVERARDYIIRDNEQTLGQPLVGAELLPFEASRPGIWQLRAAPIIRPGLRVDFPATIIIDLSPDAVVYIILAGTGDHENLARRIIESFKTTTDPECYWAALEGMLKAAYGER